MKVFNIGNKELSHIMEGLELVEQRRNNTYTTMKCMGFPQVELDAKERELTQVRTTRTLMKDVRLQELCERCLSYFADRLFDGGVDEWPEVEGLADDMGITEEELKSLFNEAGFEEE